MSDNDFETKRLLAGGIAQEIRNLLTFLLGEVSLLRAEPAGDERERRSSQVDEMLLRAAELARLLQNQIEGPEGEAGALDLAQLGRDLVNQLSHSGMPGVLTFARGTDAPAVSADAPHVRQVIKSICMAMLAKGAAENLMVRVGADFLLEDQLSESPYGKGLATGEYAFCEVSSGIAAGEPLPPMRPGFDPLLADGGLELGVLLGIVRSYRGFVAHGRSGNGRVVRVYFPVIESNPRPVRAAKASGQGDWSGTGTALFVDDEESVRMLGERLLIAFGFDVITAVDGRDGVQKYRQNIDQVSVVVLDVTMPHLNGLEAFKEMRRLRPDVPVLFISGYANAVNEGSLDAKSAFLAKPFRMAEMRSKIQQVINGMVPARS